MQNSTTTNFSRKCRDRVNHHFAVLRNILEAMFPACNDWNRFRIIERALMAIKGTSKDCTMDRTESTFNKSNKEACALYRSKLNQAFEMLKIELEINPLIDVKKYRLFTRSGILAGTIDLIQLLRCRLPQPVFRTEPIKGIKRKRDGLSDFEPFRKYQRSPDSINSTSPRSDVSDSPTELAQFNPLVQTEALLKFYAAIAQLPQFAQCRSMLKAKTSTWRPWV